MSSSSPQGLLPDVVTPGCLTRARSAISGAQLCWETPLLLTQEPGGVTAAEPRQSPTSTLLTFPDFCSLALCCLARPFPPQFPNKATTKNCLCSVWLNAFKCFVSKWVPRQTTLPGLQVNERQGFSPRGMVVVDWNCFIGTSLLAVPTPPVLLQDLCQGYFSCRACAAAVTQLPGQECDGTNAFPGLCPMACPHGTEQRGSHPPGTELGKARGCWHHGYSPVLPSKPKKIT